MVGTPPEKRSHTLDEMAPKPALKSARALSGETSADRPTSGPGATCHGCGGEIQAGRRSDAVHCKGACRARASRQGKEIPLGPKLGDLVAAYAGHLRTKTSSAQKAFSVIAEKLGPLAGRPVLSIPPEAWEAWLMTVGASQGSRELTRRYLLAALRGTPHRMPLGPGRRRIAREPARDLTPDLKQALAMTGLSQRDQLVVSLRVAGFHVQEILGLRVADNGGIQVGRPNWHRRSAPSLSRGLELRLRGYAAEKGIAPGEPLFRLTTEAIRLIIRRSLRSREARPQANLPSRLRELLGRGPQSLTTLAEASGAKPDSVYRTLRRMNDVMLIHGSRGRHGESVWDLAVPAAAE